MKKKLLILGGVVYSEQIISEARKSGIHVIVTDYLEDSPGKKIADESYMYSIRDVDSIINLIREKQIDGVITGFVDSILPYYADICEKAGLPCYGSGKQFTKLSNKAMFKALCSEFDVPIVEEFRVSFPFNSIEIEALPYPVLVKPSDYSGARGVFICSGIEELTRKYAKSLDYSPGKEVIIERYLPYKEIHLHYLMQDGEICLAAMADRHMNSAQTGELPLPVAYTYPSKYLDLYEQQLDFKVKQMLKSIGIQNGLLLLQGFFDGVKFILYEAGFRLNGTLEYKIIEKLNGLNPLQMLINYAIHGVMHDQPIKPMINPHYTQNGFSLAFISSPGQIGKIKGIDEIESLPGVIDAVCTYSEGDVIPESARGTLSQVILRVSGFAENQIDMASLMNEIQSRLTIQSTEGKNMLSDVFDTFRLFEE